MPDLPGTLVLKAAAYGLTAGTAIGTSGTPHSLRPWSPTTGGNSDVSTDRTVDAFAISPKP